MAGDERLTSPGLPLEPVLCLLLGAVWGAALGKQRGMEDIWIWLSPLRVFYNPEDVAGGQLLALGPRTSLIGSSPGT